MAKPIFLVGLSHHIAPSVLDIIRTQLRNEMPDYHVLVYLYNGDEYKFSVLNADDMEPLQFEELKSKIEELINETA